MKEFNVTTKFRRPRRLLPAFALVGAVAVCAIALFPVTAYAEAPGFDIWDLGTSLKNMICYWLLEGACWLFNAYEGVISTVSNYTVLKAPFDSLLGGGLFGFVEEIYKSAIVPVGEGILALFMLVQLVKISQRIDATSTLPAVKDIVFLAVTYVLFHWFITNGLYVLQAIYQIVVDDIIPGIADATATTDFFGDMSTDVITGDMWNSISIGSCLLVFIESILGLLVGFIAYIVAMVLAYARAVQLYVYATFSAIPISLLGFDETRQMGISFIKNFAAVALAGAVMIFMLMAYPYVVSGMMALDGIGGTAVTILTLVTAGTGSAVSGIILMLQFFAISIVLILGLLKSGAWAKEILGS